ncbi:MAG: carboxypeptidase-like regulatory domain-containing protein [Bacteroidetes bacterium]|nr:MAG: carboxypeptidase-like regulatory domain-containing protein [Bacteroidota bacterium]
MRSLLLLFNFLFFYCNAQQITGIVTDSETGKALPFVNIGFVNRGIGTVSDFNGNYALDISKAKHSDSLKFSYLGYKSYAIARKDIKNNELHVRLEPSAIVLEEAVVTNKPWKHKKAGYYTQTENTTCGFQTNEKGNEAGVKIKIKKPSYIDSVMFNVVKNPFDSIVLRINLYEIDEQGLPRKNLLPENLFVTLKGQKKYYSVSLKKYRIRRDKDFIIALEWIESKDATSIMFSCDITGSGIYFRKTSQAAWEKIPLVSMGLAAHIRY